MKRLLVVNIIISAFVVVGIALFLVWYLNGMNPRDFSNYTDTDVNALKSDSLFLASASIYGVFFVVSTFMSIIILTLTKRLYRGRGIANGVAILNLIFLHPFSILAGIVALFTIQDSGMSPRDGIDPLANKRTNVDVVGSSSNNDFRNISH